MTYLNDPGSLWIWTDTPDDIPNQYAQFIHKFSLPETPTGGELHISADSNYAVWINGTFIDTGQYHDFPDRKVYDVLDVGKALREGENTLCILAYYQGATDVHYIKGTPGLAYALKAGEKIIRSGSETLARTSFSYRSGSMPRVTPQLGFAFEYDARREDEWLNSEYQPDSTWSPARNVGRNCLTSLNPRPIEKLEILPRVEGRIVTQGIFRREKADGRTVSEEMQTDFLSTRPASEIFKSSPQPLMLSDDGIEFVASQCAEGSGMYAVIDMGREEAGILEMEVEADAGTVVDIAYGEHLDDLRVRARVGIRNFANRYVCKDGRQTFTHHLSRIAGRYMELHIQPAGERFVLHYAGLRPTEYPVQRGGSFHCADSLHNRIYEVAVRTLHLCMHEHFEDCPWREQGLYGTDSYIAATTGYYAFGNYDFAAASLSLLGSDICPDGYSRSMTTPGDIGFTIPSFNFAWILGLAEHYMYSGNKGLLQICLPTVLDMMRVHTAALTDGLLPALPGDRYWHHYEWADGLDGIANNDCTDVSVLGHTELHLPLNLYFCLALQASAQMAEALDLPADAEYCRNRAGRLKQVIHEAFWDEEEGCYASYIRDGKQVHFAELTQSLAILAGVCPEAAASKLRERLASVDSGLVRTSLSNSRYKFEALLQKPAKYGKYVFNRIAEDWGYMLSRGATSFWETIKGADDFDNAGSLCHAWSGIPAYFYYAYLLGVRPLKPGFTSFTVSPVRGVVSKASGRIPAPSGMIELSWEDLGDDLHYTLHHPEGTSVVMGDEE